MSKENRQSEYNRLIKLGRENDICDSLKKEFGDQQPKKVVETKIPKSKSKRGRKND